MTSNLEWQFKTKKIKQCNSCKQIFGFNKFYKKQGKYRSAYCKKCDYERRKKYKKLTQYKEQHKIQSRKRNSTEEGKEKLKIRNRKAYLKRVKNNFKILSLKIK